LFGVRRFAQAKQEQFEHVVAREPNPLFDVVL
jgi:hypothetical protein